MLDIAGGADVLGDIKRESVQMSTEMILARAPEVIIELHYGTALQRDHLARSAEYGTRCRPFRPSRTTACTSGRRRIRRADPNAGPPRRSADVRPGAPSIG